MKVAAHLWSKLPPLWLIVLVSSVTIYSVSFGLLISQDKRSTEATFDASDDPHPGERIVSLANHMRQGRNYVITAQPCACNAQLIEPVVRGLPHDWALIIVVPVSPERAKEKERGMPRNVLLIADENRAILNELNATYLPRSYLLDDEGRFLWAQTQMEQSWNSALLEALKFEKESL